MLEHEPGYLREEDLGYLREEDSRYLTKLLLYPVESKEVDYKSAVKFEKGKDFAAKLVKHILAFANSGGGYLIIGYKEQADGSLAPDPGITEKIVASYDTTRLCQYINTYLSGQGRIKIIIFKVEFAGIKYPIIRIYRFQECPFVCTKGCDSSESGGGAILKKNKVYIRTDEAKTCVAATIEELPEWKQLTREITMLWREARP